MSLSESDFAFIRCGYTLSIFKEIFVVGAEIIFFDVSVPGIVFTATKTYGEKTLSTGLKAHLLVPLMISASMS